MASADPRRRPGWILAAGFICTLALVPSQVAAKEKTVAPSKRVARSAFCRRGDALLGLRRIPAAEAAFEAELKAGASVHCAREGLAWIGRKRPCAVAKALLRAGERAEANRAFRESLEAKPLKKCAAKGVRETADRGLNQGQTNGPRVTPGSKTGLNVTSSSSAEVTVNSDSEGGSNSTSAFVFSDDVYELTLKLLRTLVYLAVPAVLIGLVLLNILARCRLPCLRRFRRLRLVAFVRRPSASIEPFGDGGFEPKIGVAATALLKERIEPDSGSQALKIVSGDDSPEDSFFQVVGELSPRAKVWATIGEVLLAFLPRRRFKVSGELQPRSAKRGPGISVELDRRLVSQGGITLWASEFSLGRGEDDVDAVRRLVTPAAAWISHVAARKKGDETPIMAGEAMSWAKFKAGLEWQQEGNRKKAEQLYRSAIATDAGNYGAQVNLALLMGGDGRFEDAIGWLKTAISGIEKKISHPRHIMDHTLNADWYRAKYNLASLYVNWASLSEGEIKEERLGAAEECTQEILDQIAKLPEPMNEISSSRFKRFLPLCMRDVGPELDARAMEEFLKGEILPNTTILAAEIRAAKNPGSVSEKDREEVEEELCPKRCQTDTSELNYSTARFYAWAGEFVRARKHIEAVIEKTDPGEWQALAHRIVRDPVLAEVGLRDLQPLSYFVPMLDEAMASAEAAGLEWLV